MVRAAGRSTGELTPTADHGVSFREAVARLAARRRCSASAARPARSRSCTASWSRRSAGSASTASCMRSTTACCCRAPRRSSSPSISAGCMHRTLGGLVAGTLFVAARHHRDHGAQPDLCRLWQRAAGRGAVLRTEGGGAGDRAGGGGPHRQARAQEQRDAGARRRCVRRHLLPRHPVSDHHFRCGADRLLSAPAADWRCSSRQRSRQQQAGRRRRRKPPRR